MLSESHSSPQFALQFEVRWNGRLVSLERHRKGAHVAVCGSEFVVVDGGVVVDGVRRALVGGEALALAVGPLQLTIGRAAPVPAAKSNAVDVAWWRTASVAVILMIGALTGLRLTPVIPRLDDDDLSRGRLTINRVNVPPKEPVKPQKPVPRERPVSSCCKTKEVAVNTKKPLSMKQRRDIDHQAVLTAMSELGLSASATSGVFGAGNEVDLALSKLNAVGATASGLGTRDTGGGGGGGAIGITGLIGDGSSRRGPGNSPLLADGRRRVGVTVPDVNVKTVGALDRAEIQRVMGRAMSRFRYCYEKQLNTDPNLEGKVTTLFTIGGTGDVVSAQAVDTTLKGSGVDACVVHVLQTLKFPQPRGGGVVAVTYPFVFATH